MQKEETYFSEPSFYELELFPEWVFPYFLFRSLKWIFLVYAANKFLLSCYSTLWLVLAKNIGAYIPMIYFSVLASILARDYYRHQFHLFSGVPKRQTRIYCFVTREFS